MAELWTVSQQVFTIGNLGSTAAGMKALSPCGSYISVMAVMTINEFPL
jgi:hypothetical protein